MMSMLKWHRPKLLSISILMAVTLVAAGWLALRLHREHEACNCRGDALEARIERIRVEALKQIVPGTSKDAIVHFLEENGLRASLDLSAFPSRIVGSSVETGCAEIFGCGDEVLIEVTVDVDSGGIATASPTVDSRYDDCL
jgi:hypothetical protein